MLLTTNIAMRVQADVSREGRFLPVFTTARVREALQLAHALSEVIERTRKSAARSFAPAARLVRADHVTAILVAFAATPRVYGSGVSTAAVIDGLVREQAVQDGWQVGLSVDDLFAIINVVVFTARYGRSVDYAGIAATMARSMTPYRKPSSDKVNGRRAARRS